MDFGDFERFRERSGVNDFFLADLVFDFQGIYGDHCFLYTTERKQLNEKIWTETCGVLRFENSAEPYG